MSNSNAIQIDTPGPGIGTSDDADDPLLADVPGVFEEGTFVLVGCGDAKRDPDDRVDVHEAVVGPDESFGLDWTDETGPAWRAEDLYTSSYFGVKWEFSKLVTQWARQRDGWARAILSAEHHVLPPWKPVKRYDTSIDDLGDDIHKDEDIAFNFPYKYRPDGKPLVTELDKWALMVAVGLQRWVRIFDDATVSRGNGTLRNLLVLAGKDYVEPLRERGAFDGLGNIRDNHPGITVEPTFLFEEIDADGNGEQMAWLSDAISQLTERRAPGKQVEVGRWTGDERACDRCDTAAHEATLTRVDGGVYCEACHPDRCARCDDWTHETGIGSYPLCADCQTDSGGMTYEPLPGPGHEQAELLQVLTATDGGETDE